MIKENNTTIGTNTTYGDHSAQSVKIRLDTKELIKRIETFLRGGKTIYFYADNPDTNERELCEEYVNSGERMCNEKGVQSLINWISGTLNPHIVQGNFLIDSKTGISKSYNDYIYHYNLDLSSLILINLYDWEMDIKNAEGVIDFVMNMVIPFMTRLIDNKERESYGNTIRSTETNHVQSGSKSPFGLGGR